MHRNTACGCGGHTVNIHHNTFQDTSTLRSIVIRGAPLILAIIHHNWFYDSNWSNEIVQEESYGNMAVGDNKYGTGSGAQESWNKYSKN